MTTPAAPPLQPTKRMLATSASPNGTRFFLALRKADQRKLGWRIIES